jgi:hypothetical protein
MSQNTENKYVSKEEFNALLQVVTKNIEYISILKCTLDKLSSYTVSLEKRLQLVEMKSDDIHYTPLHESDDESVDASGVDASGIDAGGVDASGVKDTLENAHQKVRKIESDDVYIDLSNSQVFESSELYATKMCKSVMKGDNCSFGQKCSFAHSINQLRRKECLYPNCYNVKPLGNGVFINAGNKMCEFWHKDETQASYAKRLKIPDVAMTIPVPPKQPIKPSILMTAESSVLDSTVYNTIRGQVDTDQDLYGIHEYIKGCDCPACDGNLKDRCD